MASKKQQPPETTFLRWEPRAGFGSTAREYDGQRWDAPGAMVEVPNGWYADRAAALERSPDDVFTVVDVAAAPPDAAADQDGADTTAAEQEA